MRRFKAEPDAVKEAFKADPEFAAEVEAKVREALVAAG